jgi:putative membrane protein
MAVLLSKREARCSSHKERNIMTKSYKEIICRGLIAVSVLVATLALRAEDNDAGKSKSESSVSNRDSSRAKDPETCIKQAAEMNAATIKFAELASQKAENPELKRYAQSLQRDHQKAQTELETIAKNHNVTLATTVDAKCQEELTRLEGLNGAEFDKEFAKGAVEGHAKAIAHLQQASSQAKDPEIAQYTRNMLTRLKEHQQEGRDIAKAVGVDDATITSLESKAQEGLGAPAGAETESTGKSSKNSDQQKSSKDSDQQKNNSDQQNQQSSSPQK